MPIDENAYSSLEQEFREQVIKDRCRGIECYYLPCVKPENKVDYIFVGMEPSSGGVASVEEGEERVREGKADNFGLCAPPPYDTSYPLGLFKLSFDRFLSQPGETYYMTDVSKGAMLVKNAANNRKQRFEHWYPLLQEEIGIVGKPGATIIAIGKVVQELLKRKTRHHVDRVLHYSPVANAHRKREAKNDCEGFEAFQEKEFGEGGRWAKVLNTSEKHLIFTYYKQFGRIRASESPLLASQFAA